MNKIIKKIFELLPITEVWARHLYVHSKKCTKKIKKINSNHNKTFCDKDKVIAFLRSNLCDGDVVIIHTRMSALKIFGFTPNSLITTILNIIGKAGTLFAPAMPNYEEISSLKNFNDECKVSISYDRDKTPSWTGIVGNVFIKEFGAIRSPSPYCTLAGFGPYVDYAFEKDGVSDYIFGKESSWYKIMERQAKILFLGAEAYDSITEAHLVEDSFEGFNVSNWHLNVDFLLNNNEHKTIHIRRPYWNRYLTEFKNIKVLKKHNIIHSCSINGVEFSCVHSFKELYKYYCKECLRNKYSLFKIPKKYRRSLVGK